MSETITGQKAVIIGGGLIGVEFSYVWANYGVEVTTGGDVAAPIAQ